MIGDEENDISTMLLGHRLLFSSPQGCILIRWHDLFHKLFVISEFNILFFYQIMINN